MDLASGPTFSRLENAVSTKDIYRMAQSFVDQFIASYCEAPEVIVIDMDHSEDPTHGQQEFSFYNHYRPPGTGRSVMWADTAVCRLVANNVSPVADNVGP